MLTDSPTELSALGSAAEKGERVSWNHPELALGSASSTQKLCARFAYGENDISFFIYKMERQQLL